MPNSNWKSPQDVKDFAKELWSVDVGDEEAQHLFETKDDVQSNGLTFPHSYYLQEKQWKVAQNS